MNEAVLLELMIRHVRVETDQYDDDSQMIQVILLRVNNITTHSTKRDRCCYFINRYICIKCGFEPLPSERLKSRPLETT